MKSMIDQAIRRNRVHVDNGTAVFNAVAQKDADVGEHRFDKAVAVSPLSHGGRSGRGPSSDS